MFMFCEDPRIINLEIDLVVLFNPKALLAQEACVHNACLRAPCVAWPLLSPSFSLSSSSPFLAQAACMRHA